MQEYRNMELKELARQLMPLDDETFCAIIKKLEEHQLRELTPLLGVDKMLRIGSEIAFRKSVLPQVDKEENKSATLQIELTASDIVPTPNLILRSSLFSASKTHGAQKQSIYNFKIETYGKDSKEDIKIFLTAYRPFDQLDLDLLLELIKLQQVRNSHIIKISSYELVKRVKGVGESQQYYEQIKEQLELLRNANIKIKYGRYTFVGGILNNAYFDDQEKAYIIKFNEDLQPLFTKSNWTGLDTNIRKKLKTNLAKWLHGFYSSHTNSKLPIKLETIYQLSGAVDKDVAQWKRITLTRALDNLKNGFEDNGKKFNYVINNGLLFVSKTQSVAQNKNIKNKIIVQAREKRKTQAHNPKS